MQINKINTINTQSRIRNNTAASAQKRAQNNPSFKGSITYGINSSRKYVDYGDIFRDGANLAGQKLKKAKTHLARLINANLYDADLNKSSLQGANFSGANLKGANFQFANLSGSWFKNTITDNTNFMFANLHNTIFEGKGFGPSTDMEFTNVTGADFRKANLDFVNLSNSIYDKYTEFPRGFDPDIEKIRLLKPGADFSNLDHELQRMKLRYLNFTNMNFEYSNLKRTDLKGSRFENCNIRNTNLTRAYAKEAEINNCDFENSDLKQLNLKKAELYNVNMKNCNLRGAVLTWRRARNVDLRGSYYDQYTVFNSGFNPKSNGMIYMESTNAYYGIK